MRRRGACVHVKMGSKVVRRGSGRKRLQKGILTVELVLVLPLVLMLLFALVELSMIARAQQTLIVAARDGARTASLSGATAEQVEQAVRRHLRGRLAAEAQIRIELAKRSGEPATVQVRAPMHAVAPDLLRMIGFGISDRYIVARTTMCKE